MQNDQTPTSEGIIRGQRVKRVKQERARELRRSMTPAEVALWQHLRAHRFDGLHWRRQQVIAGFIADFYCHQARVIVELDGAVHIHQAEYDHARDAFLVQHGLRILRFTNTEVTTDIASVLARIRAACQNPAPSQPR